MRERERERERENIKNSHRAMAEVIVSKGIIEYKSVDKKENLEFLREKESANILIKKENE